MPPTNKPSMLPDISSLQTFTRDEVSQHSSPEDLHIIIDSRVYDLTNFADAHPGGDVVLHQVAGKDATADFYNLHRHEVLHKYPDLCIGVVANETPQIVDLQPGDISQVPYAEPAWLRKGFKTPPWFTESHKAWQKEIRKFVEEVVKPDALEKEVSGERHGKHVIEGHVERNLMRTKLGPGKHLQGQTLLGGLKGEDFDYFHEMIASQEFVRTTTRGYNDGMLAGMIIGLPPILNFYHADLPQREKVIKEVFSGEKMICLAITEAFAGSDVAGIRTTAKKTADGRHYVVNGTKKWITNSVWSDYFTVGVRTGPKELSVLLIERGEGVETRPIKTNYSPAAGTGYVTFTDVHVPVTNLVGTEGDGLKVILSNFNHERWMMACATSTYIRLAVEDSFKWANQRTVFGAPLINQPVIRQKLAKMSALSESCQSWLEAVTWQMCNMTYDEQSKYLAGQIALLKMYMTRAARDVADEAVQIFGGRAVTQGGMGRWVESFHRTYKFDAILGGSEEILADLAIRQAMKMMPKERL